MVATLGVIIVVRQCLNKTLRVDNYIRKRLKFQAFFLLVTPTKVTIAWETKKVNQFQA